jgi:MoCo/4Fe-4S cofactor protein with predicted Tat translocation signal
MSSMNPKKAKPQYWRSLSELEGDPEFHEFVAREFREPLEQQELSSGGRRRFMQLMGASFALAGCNWKQEKLLPHTSQPEGVVPGVPQFYATVMDVGGVATGLLAKSFDGRPIKIEGRPGDSTTGGGTGPYHQAAILGLYDPDRSTKVFQGGSPSSWEAFDQALLAAWAGVRANAGAGFAVLSAASSSPSLARLRAELKKAAPAAAWHVYDPSHSAGRSRGPEFAFGKPARTVLAPAKADVIVAFDSDFLAGSSPGGIGYTRAVASRRDPDHGTMSRIYAVEPLLSEIGALADHRASVTVAQTIAALAYVDAKVSAAKGAASAQPEPAVEALGGPAVQRLLDVAIQDLLHHAGKTLVTVGSRYPADVHAVAHRLNVLLGNVGSSVSYFEPADELVGGVDDLAALVGEIEGGKVQALLILGANPVYDAPGDINFAAALAKVAQSFHVGLYRDETGEKCTFHAPEAHFLETWSDARASDGTCRIGQPLIDSFLGGRSSLEVLGRLLGIAEPSAMAIVRATTELKADKAWAKAVHAGEYGKAPKSLEPQLQAIAPVAIPQGGGLEVIFDLDPAVFDGRFANNGWLQELPHPLSKQAWGNAALVGPETAERLGLGDGHLCEVSVEGRKVSLPSIISPGQAEGTIALALGYGRTVAGVVGGFGSGAEPVEVSGSNTYLIRPSKSPHVATGASAQKTGPRQMVAITQDLWAIDAIGKTGQKEREDQLIREATLAEYKHHPGVIEHKVHHPKLLSLWQPPVSYDGHKWGLAVDLNKCTGCSTCIVACQSENNTPVVGMREVAKGREMTWLRVERYYKGDAKKASVRQQPVMCQQCENAPCEQVCPVGATMHSEEGLNDMVYNRCIGTRYCSNNCPYKVRRFNYRNYNLEFYGTTPYTGTDDRRAKLKAMAFNPEVTVRSRGVMEKCTFCVQRIQNVKIVAKNNKRPIQDGEIKTACEQACPAGAITFGDLNDKASRVHSAQGVPRAYELLQELNNRPRVNYLARISNPHPELSENDGHSSEHH